MEMNMDPPESLPLCPLCGRVINNSKEKVAIVGQRGLKTLIDKSKSYNDDKWQQWNELHQLVCHMACRKRYMKTSEPSLSQDVPISDSSFNEASTSSQSGSNSNIIHFDLKKDCLFCGRFRITTRTHLIRQVKDESYKDRIINTAQRRNDPLAAEVLERISGIASLPGEEAGYHIKCASRFFNITPSVREPSPRTVANKACFEAVCQYIESSKKFEFSVSELKEIMNDSGMCNITLYKKLTEKYGKDVYIQHSQGKQTVIHYKYFNFGHMSERFYKGEELHEREKHTIYKVAAALLKNDIKNCEYKNDCYSSPTDFLKTADHDIPQSLWKFLELLLESENTEACDRLKMKRVTAAHLIISSIRSQSFVSTLQLAVGTYVYRKTGSKQIVELLEKMGISASYNHLVQFENSIVLNPPEMKIEEGVHVQHVFDNTDHNVTTLDGRETFHCLGGIAVYTPESAISYEGCIKRVTEYNTASPAAVAKRNRIKAIPYSYLNAKGLKAIEYTDPNALLLATSPRLPPPYAAYLWAKSFEIHELPSWSGFMEVLSGDDGPVMSRLVCLPFINEAPSEPTTINTALHYALSDAKKLKQKTCFVTFDQPLYQKARTIVAESQENDQMKDVYVRLGGYHLLLSYLGAIGYIMSGSGIESLWSDEVYAPNLVKMMLNGHEYSKAMRAHILTFTALGIEICRSAKNDKIEEYRTFISSFLEKWNAEPPEPPTIGDCRADPVVAEMTEEFVAQIDSLNNNGPTAQLWLQYFEFIVIALQFVEAERLGNWKLHLQSVRKMLPVFHAAGDLPCAKSAQLYLQDMVKLENHMEHNEYIMFAEEGYFTVRRSNKYWSGIWTDMVTEQTLNRYFGTGVEHGRGATPGVVARYLLAMPTMVSVMASIEEYFHMSTLSSQQHKDLDPSRQKRDEADLAKFLSWIRKHEPFKARPTLVSLSTGLVGDPETNCHLAIEIGEKLMLSMVGKSPEDVLLSMTNRVQNLESAKAGIHLGGVSRINIDTTELFRRISLVCQNDNERKKGAFNYELSPFPLALFDDKGFMRKPPKSELYKIMKPYKPTIERDLFLQDVTFVIDGSFLLHSVTWPLGSTYQELFERYRVHIVANYRANAWVVFDGYSDEYIGIKSYERYHHRAKNFSPSIEISGDMSVTLAQEKFLSNPANEFRFVHLLATYLKKESVNVKVAEGDADTLIVNTAIKLNELVDGPVAVVGNDTNLFVLLVALTDARKTMYFYKSVPPSGEAALYSTSDYKHLQEFILFAHTFVGCDSTSAIYGKSKKTVIDLLEQNHELRQRCRAYYDPECTSKTLLDVAQKIILHLYGFESDEITLGAARYEKYELPSVSNSIEARLASLPPTAAALMEHAKRVYLQIQTWLGNVLRPDDWGWTRSETLLLPIMTTDNVAPEELLNMVSCSCTTECVSSRCSCKKSGMLCYRFCKHCNGVRCKNPPYTRSHFASENEADEELGGFVIGDESLQEGTWLEESDNDEEDCREEDNLQCEDFY